MIKVARPSPPGILRQKAALWKWDLLQALRRYRRVRGARPKQDAGRALRLAEECYRHPQVKQALVELFHGKCAYCESKIPHVDYGHIEHYRPRWRFPGLTFDWSNLLLACGTCNGAGHKGDRFPAEDEGGPLVNPCEDDPSKHLDFRFDRDTRLASVYGKTPRGITTEKVLGLNRPELRAFRSTEVCKLAVLARLARTDPEARSLLEAAARSDAQFAAFARLFSTALR
jgi:uncharacterized protein (TIGR02646 family)